MTTFLARLEPGGTGPRLAVKDLIDVEGEPTTAGCLAVADGAEAAPSDAPCLSGARAADARIVGKTNLHELAFGTTGINAAFGTPRNPLDPKLVPGGSSSGSAVAVATGEADVAYGSDTGGSVRIPSACCGTAGLKTTHGRIPLDRVWPVAQTLDTVGPMARDTDGLVLGMQLLGPGFAVADGGPAAVGRFRIPGARPEIDRAVDEALATAELHVEDVELPGWTAAEAAAITIILAEAYRNDRELLERRDRLGDDVADRIARGAAVTEHDEQQARVAQAGWLAELTAVLSRVEMIALPTLLDFPPTLDDGDRSNLTAATIAVNLSGLPALALPVPVRASRLPASLQLIGPANGEDRLLAAGKLIERAVS